MSQVSQKSIDLKDSHLVNSHKSLKFVKSILTLSFDVHPHKSRYIVRNLQIKYSNLAFTLVTDIGHKEDSDTYKQLYWRACTQIRSGNTPRRRIRQTAWRSRSLGCRHLPGRRSILWPASNSCRVCHLHVEGAIKHTTNFGTHFHCLRHDPGGTLLS